MGKKGKEEEGRDLIYSCLLNPSDSLQISSSQPLEMCFTATLNFPSAAKLNKSLLSVKGELVLTSHASLSSSRLRQERPLCLTNLREIKGNCSNFSAFSGTLGHKAMYAEMLVG